MNPHNFLLSSVIVLVIGAGVTFLLAYLKEKSNKLCGYISLVFVVVSAIEILIVSIVAITEGPLLIKEPLLTVPGISAGFTFNIDTLSALFLGMIAILMISVAAYSVKFMAIPYYEDLTMVGYYPPLLLYFASLIMVVSLNDMFFFFMAWEFMTLSSYTLVIFDRKRVERLRAGFKYFIMTHIATACMFLAAIILYNYGESFNFASLRSSMSDLLDTHPALVHLILGLFFIGFATKAGVLPFGDWLPDAYPAAPTPAASMFGGIMSKIGVYGIIRVFCEILPISAFSEYWGIIIAIFGTFSIFVGTMTALVQEDTKKLLAFHVIGQIGYMLLGIGIGIYFLPSNKFIAAVALVSGIFHLFNNALYKSSLFLSSGSIFYKTGTRNLNEIGGLSKLLPMTAFTTAIASLSIAGMPPFNGFSSKWLIYQSSIVGGMSNPLFIALGIVAIFISAVTLASFFKFFGASFLGKLYQNGEKLKKGDVPKLMLIPQIVLSSLCVVIGIFPVFAITVIHNAVSGIFEPGIVPSMNSLYGNSLIGITLSFGNGIFANWNPVIILIAFFTTLAIAYFLYQSGKVKERSVSTWYCGEEHTDEEVRYTAHSYYLPFKQFFRIRIGKYYREGVYPSISVPKITISEINPFKKILEIDQWLYYPLVSFTFKMLKKFSRTHVGIPHVYLLWMVLGLIIGVVVLFSLP